jgi:hypothetical protein
VISGTITVKPGVINEVFAENVKGWLLIGFFDATDAFTNLSVQMPPETFKIVQFNLAELAATGVTLPLAASFVLTTFNFTGLPLDSSGYGATQFNLPYPLPLKKNNVIHIQFTLDPGTTQLSASVDYDFVFAQIYRPDLFTKSLKQVYSGKYPEP